MSEYYLTVQTGNEPIASTSAHATSRGPSSLPTNLSMIRSTRSFPGAITRRLTGANLTPCSAVPRSGYGARSTIR
jgi:hypothetical protein